MKNLSIIGVLLILLGYTSVSAQSRSQNTPTEKSPIEEEIERFRASGEGVTVVEETFALLERSLRDKELAYAQLMTSQDVQLFLDRYDPAAGSSQQADRQAAQEKIDAIISDAKMKLASVGNALNVTLVDSYVLYGDEEKLSKILKYRMEIVGEKEQQLLYEILCVELNGAYKILSVKDDF